MNLTTSSYVEVDLKPLASAVVFRSAMEDCCWAWSTSAVTATAAIPATTRRIWGDPPGRILLHLRLLTGVSAVLLSERRTCFEAAPRTDKRSGDQEGIYRSL